MPYRIFKTCINNIYVTNGKLTIEMRLRELVDSKQEDEIEIRRKINLIKLERSLQYEELNNEETNRMLYTLEKIKYALTVDMNDVLLPRREQLYNYYNLYIFGSVDKSQTLQLINEVLYDARNIERVHFEPITMDEKNIEEIKLILRCAPLSVINKLKPALKNHIEIKKEFVCEVLNWYNDRILMNEEYIINDEKLLKWLLNERKHYAIPFALFKNYKSLIKEMLVTNNIIEIRRN